MNQIVKGVFIFFCFQILFRTNNTLKILIRGDLSSKDTLLIILKMEVMMATPLLRYNFMLKQSNEFPLTKECTLIPCIHSCLLKSCKCIKQYCSNFNMVFKMAVN